ncbi:MAG: hypothetical protein NT094_02195 [Candidatus Staskawiczbacteria bacterium]|nr:hypothetical protein [Candidatus Staskawiczbacteria bacterium]
MKESKEHLNIDLDFLGEKESAEKSHKTEDKPNYVPTRESNIKNKTEQTVQPDFKINWSTVFTVLFILFFIGAGIYSSNSNDSNTVAPVSSPNINTISSNVGDNSLGRLKGTASNDSTGLQEEDVIVGEYTCSASHSREAKTLIVDETLEQIDSANNAIIIRGDKIDRLKEELDNTSVNDYSEQWEVDAYNEKVNDYNSQLPAYNRDLESASARTEKYNSQVQVYNDYLENNCTKRN